MLTLLVSVTQLNGKNLKQCQRQKGDPCLRAEKLCAFITKQNHPVTNSSQEIRDFFPEKPLSGSQ